MPFLGFLWGFYTPTVSREKRHSSPQRRLGQVVAKGAPPEKLSHGVTHWLPPSWHFQTSSPISLSVASLLYIVLNPERLKTCDSRFCEENNNFP